MYTYKMIWLFSKYILDGLNLEHVLAFFQGTYTI